MSHPNVVLLLVGLLSREFDFQFDIGVPNRVRLLRIHAACVRIWKDVPIHLSKKSNLRESDAMRPLEEQIHYNPAG